MEAFDITINNLPVKTWNHLRMNEAKVSQVALSRPGKVALSGPLSFTQAEAGPFAAIPTGSGKDVDKLLSAADIQPQHLLVSGGVSGSTRLTYAYEDGAADGSILHITLEKGSSATILMDYTASPAASGTAAVQTKILAGENSLLRLVQVQRVGQQITFFNDLGADCAQGARVELIQLVLSGKGSYTGCQATLTGDHSSLEANLAYSLTGQEKLDLNYVARHVGKHTESNLNAAGALQGNAAKLFRGTIDFVKGCAGSVGNEKEEVLLMDDTTANQTIPLILCAEEDVEGNHGASIGKPDEEVLFYLAARGIPQEEAYAMLSRAKLDAAAGKIWDADFRQEILDHIKGGAQDE
jgi:hypothetical protein